MQIVSESTNQITLYTQHNKKALANSTRTFIMLLQLDRPAYSHKAKAASGSHRSTYPLFTAELVFSLHI